MAPGRRSAVRCAAVSAGVLLVAEVLALIAWAPLFNGLVLLAMLTPVAIPALGAVLLTRGDERGIAVLVVGAALALPSLLLDGLEVLRWTDPFTPTELVVTGLELVHAATLLAAGLLAWRLRTVAAWTWHRPVPWVYAVAATATLAMAELWPRRSFVLPGDVVEAASLLQLVAFAAVLVAIARLPRMLAGAALLAAVTPALAIALFDVAQSLSFTGGVYGPGGVACVIARSVLTLIGVHWLRPEHMPQPEHRTETAPDTI